MKINNIILVLCTCIILSSSFVIYFFHICHSESFPIVIKYKISMTNIVATFCHLLTRIHQVMKIITEILIIIKQHVTCKYNRKISQMTHIQKKYTTNEDGNIIRVCSMSIIWLISTGHIRHTLDKSYGLFLL